MTDNIEIRCVDPSKTSQTTRILLSLAITQAGAQKFTLCESLPRALSLLPIVCTEIRTGLAQKLRHRNLSASPNTTTYRLCTQIRSGDLRRSVGDLGPRTRTIFHPLREGGICVGEVILINDEFLTGNSTLVPGSTRTVVECLTQR